MEQIIKHIARRFFTAAALGKNPFDDTATLTTNKKILRQGQEEGRALIKKALKSKGYNQDDIEKFLEGKGI